MPVIINEFEIITEQPPTEQAAPPTALTPPEQPPALRPEDVERIMRRQMVRMERIRAD